jgi:Peptidase family M28
MARPATANSDAAPLARQIGVDRLRAHVAKLAAEIGERNVSRSRALHATAECIRSEWSAMGYQVAAQSYRAQGVLSENLDVTCEGQSKPSEIILVGAHYDSVPGSPGANDNASGVAALLEISRGFAKRAPARSVRFVAFVNEEAPFFCGDQMGSMVYAKAARARGDDIRLMVSLEMLGCFTDESGSQCYPPLLRFFYPDRATSSLSCPTLARAGRCANWSMRFAPIRISQPNRSPRSNSSRASPGATTPRSGDKAIVP